MIREVPQRGGPSTHTDDTRISRARRELSKMKVGALPQLINVLKGDMGLMGPPHDRGCRLGPYSSQCP